MSDILPTLILIGLVYGLYRWLTGPKTPADPLRNVRREMVEAVTSVFPDVPVEAIVYSLSRTRSAQTTSEMIIERGSLPPPPPGFTVPDSLRPAPPAGPSSATPAAPAPAVSRASLIERYNLGAKVAAAVPSVPSVPSPVAEAAVAVPSAAGAGGKWEATREEREKELRGRKERMILEARRRMLEKQAAKE